MRKTMAVLAAMTSIGVADADWEISRAADPMDDSIRVAASVAATDGYAGPMGFRKEAKLFVRCWRDRLEVFVATDSFLLSSRASARIRFDETPAQSVDVNVSEGNRAVFLLGGQALLEDLSQHNIALFELRASGHRYLIEFPLAGSAQAISQVMEHCQNDETLDGNAEGLTREKAKTAAQRSKLRFVSVWARVVRSAWTRPPSSPSDLSADVQVQLRPSGEVVNIEVVRSSGDLEFDRSVENAIRRTSPLPVPDDAEAFRRAGLDKVTFRFKPD